MTLLFLRAKVGREPGPAVNPLPCTATLSSAGRHGHRRHARTMAVWALLAGFGITAGEGMPHKLDSKVKEKWLWDTYGEGVRDALKSEPQRVVRMIHRFHWTAQSEIIDAWKDYPGFPATFDFSFKYSVAHMYSIPNPPFIQDVLQGMPAGRRTWLTVRNDDVYSFRWGNPEYARAYIKAIPGPDRIAGFYMGPDGYIWGREFLSRRPQKPHQLVMQKQWYSFLLWGRLAYDPALPDEHFQSIVTQKFPEVNGAALYRAWGEASMVFPLITRFFWGDIDLKWFPEACLSHPRHRGFYTVRHFVEGRSMPGSGVLSVLEWRKKKLAGEAMGGVTPLEIAAQLEAAAGKALQGVQGMRGERRELKETLGDIRAMSYLAQYYAAKIRGATALALYDRSSSAADKGEAVQSLQRAVQAWQSYAQAYTEQYTTPHLYNRVGFVDMNGLTIKVKQDIDIAERWKPGTIAGDEGVSNAGDRLFRK
ncbi:MAG: hypothetical protein JNL62_26690 [Bryobacterales bacterium]|nr:hypothetical protein [Bryobacterales bacterium]